MDKKFEILNYGELPKKTGFGANAGKLLIDWSKVEKGFVLKTNHIQYGYNEFIFIGCEGKLLTLKYSGNIISINKCNFTQGKIGVIIGKFKKGFQLDIGRRLIDSNRDLNIIDRKYIDDEKMYKYKCNVCGFSCGEHYRTGELNNEFWIQERNLTKKGTGCACCSNRAIVPEINSIYVKAPWMIELGVSEEDAKKYSVCNANRIKVTCPYCKRDKIMAIHNIYNGETISCSCGDGYSRGHKYVRNILEQLNIKFDENIKSEWCNFYNKYRKRNYQGEYDFIIEECKIIVEVDGGFHRKDNSLNGQTKEESQFIDSEKDKLAEKNGYKIIRVFYNDKYSMGKEDIVKSDMSKYFDLSNINWEKAMRFANGNLIKDVCDRWKNKEDDDTTGTLAKEYNLSSVTISKYLLAGNKLGWCEYDKKEELKKNALRMSKITSKTVEVFKDEKSLGVFESASGLERQSEELFGVKLHQAAISKVCKREQNNHKGFTFRYVEE